MTTRSAKHPRSIVRAAGAMKSKLCSHRVERATVAEMVAVAPRMSATADRLVSQSQKAGWRHRLLADRRTERGERRFWLRSERDAKQENAKISRNGCRWKLRMPKRKRSSSNWQKKKQLEEEADSSLLALERMGHIKQPPHELERDRRHDRKASRSRSVRRPRSRNRRPGREGRDGSYSVSVKRDRSRGRRRRQRPAGPRDRAAFDEALRRRMEEREARDTTRIPVVDPGHAQRMLGGYR